MLKTRPQFTRRGRSLLPGQVSQLITMNSDGSNRQVLLEADEVFEAPNWTPDGLALIINAGGELWRVPVDGSDDVVRIDGERPQRLRKEVPLGLGECEKEMAARQRTVPLPL